MMIISRSGANLVALSIVIVQLCFAEPPDRIGVEETEPKTRSQVMESLPVRVVDSRGEPVRDAIVDRVTHFSRIMDFEVPRDGKLVVDVPLSKVRPIEGVLSNNVPRPVTEGRIKVRTVPQSDAPRRRVQWSTWVPIRADGTFTVEAWPIDEKIQLIALCDGFIASSGEAPPEYEGPDSDHYLRPQVFDRLEASSITVEMVPLVECVVKTIDEESQPVAGVTVEACPNVGWWNVGSQIYCATLNKTERFLKYRIRGSSIDHVFPQPFRTNSDRNGIAKLELPEGKRSLSILSDAYELPIYLGARRARTELASGETSEVTMLMQARGTERLSDWDSLAGVVFGCSTREGRRILALPGVSEKMEEFTERFREAKAQDDPELLAGAYAVVAGAFADIEDFGEAARWYEKASRQQQEIGRTDD